MWTALFLCFPPAQEAAPAPVRTFAALLERALEQDDPEALYAAANADFRQAVPLATVRQIVRTVRGACGSELQLEVDPAGWDAAGMQHVLRAAGAARAAVFRVSFDAGGQVAGLFQQFEAPVWNAAELDAATASWEGDWGYAAASLPAGGAPARRAAAAAGRSLFPLGSIFKVYVLAEFARRVGLGELDWEQPLAVREEWKSLPSGTMQDEPNGSAFPLREYVRRMIGISDNTATDHLVQFLGRAEIEARLAACRNSAPERNQPFLTTGEMFALKGLPESAPAGLAELAAAWRDGDAGARRRLLAAAEEAWAEYELEERRASAGLNYLLRTLEAREHVEIEWFAAPGDVVDLYLAAAADALYSPAASAVFREGLAYGAALYVGPWIRYHGFKGGSETGILTLAVLVTLEDGRTAAARVCRCGFAPGDPEVAQETVDLVNALARGLLEGRLGTTVESGR